MLPRKWGSAAHAVVPHSPRGGKPGAGPVAGASIPTGLRSRSTSDRQPRYGDGAVSHLLPRAPSIPRSRGTCRSRQSRSWYRPRRWDFSPGPAARVSMYHPLGTWMSITCSSHPLQKKGLGSSLHSGLLPPPTIRSRASLIGPAFSSTQYLQYPLPGITRSAPSTLYIISYVACKRYAPRYASMRSVSTSVIAWDRIPRRRWLGLPSKPPRGQAREDGNGHLRHDLIPSSSAVQ